jgi:hypothetical protein
MYTGGRLPARFTKQEREEVAENAPSSVVEAPENGLPSVLVTNDDGINAPGLRTLVAALIEDGSCNVFVCSRFVSLAYPVHNSKRPGRARFGFQTMDDWVWSGQGLVAV